MPRPDRIAQAGHFSTVYSSNFHAGNSTGNGCHFRRVADRVCAMAINIQRLEIRHRLLTV
jgi:hypothetical protein